MSHRPMARFWLKQSDDLLAFVANGESLMLIMIESHSIAHGSVLEGMRLLEFACIEF
jgi:hypothetical protein